MRRLLFLLTLCYLLFNAKPLLAHGSLIRVEPADGTALAESPGEILFWFDEKVVPRFSSMRLLDSKDQPVAGLQLEPEFSEAGALRLRLPPLGKGSYLLFWKVLSDEDGHFSQGLLTFSVGMPAAQSGQTVRGQTVQSQTSPIESGLRWLNFLLLTTTVGALAVRYLLLLPLHRQPSDEALQQQQQLRTRLLYGASLTGALAFVVGIGLLGWQRALTFDSSSTTGWMGDSWQIITQTLWGKLWLARQAILLFLACGLLWLARKDHTESNNLAHLLVAGRAIDLLLIQSLSSHQIGNQADWQLRFANLTLHWLAASLWMGGLLALAFLVSPFVQRKQAHSPGWQPVDWVAFGKLAACSVALLFISGLYSMGQQVASLDALVTTGYGWALLTKVLIVLLAGLFGLFNLSLLQPELVDRLTPWLSKRIPPAWRMGGRLPRFLLTEALLGMLILGISSWLSASVPPNSIAYTIDPITIHPLLGKRADGLLVTLEAKPNRLGNNLFTVRALGTAESQRVLRTVLNFHYQGENSQGLEPATTIAEEVETGVFQAAGNYLPLPGPWQVEVRMVRADGSEQAIKFDWVAPPSETVAPVVVSKALLASVLTPLASVLFVALLLGVLGSRFLKSGAWQSKQLDNSRNVPTSL